MSAEKRPQEAQFLGRYQRKSRSPDSNRLEKLDLLDRIRSLEDRVVRLEKMQDSRVRIAKSETRKKVVDLILSSRIDLGEYAHVHELKGLDLFLAVLNMASKELEVKELTAPDVSRILEEKFGIREGTDRTTISNRLAGAIRKGLVDRIHNPDGKGYAYSLTAKGISYLSSRLEGSQELAGPLLGRARPAEELQEVHEVHVVEAGERNLQAKGQAS